MASLEDLTTKIADAASLEQSVDLLLGDLAERIKATSNDTNIQRLARDLKAATPSLASAIARKPAAAP